MITRARVREDLEPNGYDWIFALRAAGVGALAENGALQPTLFDDQDMAETECRELFGGIGRPLLVALEEAHRCLSSGKENLALETTRKIAKEGRKYGVGAMVVSQRPSEVDETILSQCGTYFALRLSNPSDRQRVQGTLSDGLAGLLDVLPILRTGEAIFMGEGAKLPMRCRITLPAEEHRPRSSDPVVAEAWAAHRKSEGYDRVVVSWREQSPRAIVHPFDDERASVEDSYTED